ncbi:UPF0489 family protein [Williamsia sp. CHRR-6]|uniref:UPF0489 family protein n=1 Tax=Williamsia sp. CHRR-6 TaxID=2835871 RepID=UPI001BDA0C90|nr:UPF0489 family protein [Williamsia sp. CHRR-6]MBT0568648.1 UPF0489 family protein [Williamsia sp. CHRR-6]
MTATPLRRNCVRECVERVGFLPDCSDASPFRTDRNVTPSSRPSIAPQRVLDIDLDFFVTPPVHFATSDGPRPSSEDHSVWPLAHATRFLRDTCGVTQKLPGFVTTTHDQLFFQWRDALERDILTPPFHVTHLDAHADLGLGENGYTYLMTELLFTPPTDRPYAVQPDGRTGITEGSFLLYAIGCRWISDLTYVYGDGGGSDELPYAMKSFDARADEIQLPAIRPEEFRRSSTSGQPPEAESHEPAIPYHSTHAERFVTTEPYDFICLTKSPGFTPPTADPLFDLILSEFFA